MAEQNPHPGADVTSREPMDQAMWPGVRGHRAAPATTVEARLNLDDRKRAEEEITRLNRALTALSRCNQALIHTQAEAELLRTICHIIVGDGGYLMSWVGRAIHDARQSVQPLAWSGENAFEFISEARITWADERDCGASGRAIRTGEPILVRNIGDDPSVALLADVAARYRHKSVLSLPLKVQGEVWGSLTIVSGEHDPFDAKEVALLTELAGNVAFGIGALEARAQKQLVQQELRDSEGRYRLLFERNLAGVYRSTIDGVLLECNDAFRRIFGYDSREELYWLHCGALYCDLSQREQLAALLIEQGSVLNVELLMRRKDGTSIVVLGNAVLLRDDLGKPLAVEGTILDITETRKLQEQLAQSQKMEAIGNLAGGIAHDFNNLLMVISSYSEMLQNSLTDARLKRYAEHSLKAAQRAAELTRGLLAFSRKQVMAPEVVDLNAVVREIARMLPRLIAENIQLDLILSAEPVTTRVDPAQMQQVIMNLAVNARDAMPSGGRLSVETALVQFDGDDNRHYESLPCGHYVMLAVKDNGRGIDPAIMPHIFEPFFTTKGPGKGTGLGLSMVYGTVRQTGGHIFAYSELGHGTTFKIYLPHVAANPTALPEVVKTDVQPRGTETVLLVEDEAALRDAAAEFLVTCGYHVLQACCGDEALEIAEACADSIHLLLTDVIMPGRISGPELARRVLQSRPETRVLYMSGYTESTALQHDITNLAPQFLQKPFSFNLLGKKIREVLEANSAPASAYSALA